MTKHAATGISWSERLRVPWSVGADGVARIRLADIDTGGMPGVADKEAAAERFDATARTLATLQEQLFASSLYGGERAVLLVLQGMDTAGKGGTVKRVAGSMDPQGLAHHAFKKPTEEESAHPFLWRVEKRLPQPGQIGVFDRSHYEDLLVPRVHGLLGELELSARADEINAFEKRIVDNGTAVIKVFLHLGFDEQKRRLLRRLDRSDKHWKFTEADVDDRALWPRFQAAYEATFTATDSSWAPWHVVPTDRKWYSTLAVQQLLAETLAGFDLSWPQPAWNPDEQRTRLLAT